MSEEFKEKLREKLTHPILILILVILSIGLTVFYTVSSNVLKSKAETINDLDIQSVSYDDDGELVVAMNDEAASIDEAYEQAKADLEEAANGESVNTDKITEFFETRYNYTGAEKNSAASVAEKLKDDCTEDYLKSVKETMEKSDDSDGCTCTVNNIYTNGKSMDDLGSAVSLYYYYDVTIDGQRQLQKVTMGAKNGSWVISSTEKVANLEDE